jgi:hypothetical protein
MMEGDAVMVLSVCQFITMPPPGRCHKVIWKRVAPLTNWPEQQTVPLIVQSHTTWATDVESRQRQCPPTSPSNKASVLHLR